MIEGERVVFEFVGTQWAMPGDYYLTDRGSMSKMEGAAAGDRTVYRRIPDPVPALEARIAELEGVIRLCEREGDEEPKTANDVLSVLSSYIADFMPPDSIPGDEYFAAWEKQARVVIEPLFQKLASLDAELKPYREQKELIRYHFDPTKTVKMESSGDGILFG